MTLRTGIMVLAALAVLVVAGYAVTVLLFESGGRVEQPRTVTAGTVSTSG